jgi:hypothetical protein
MPEVFAPKRKTEPEQVQAEEFPGLPTATNLTLHGGSALPGSAVNPVTGVQAPWQAAGFVGTRSVPGGEG